MNKRILTLITGIIIFIYVIYSIGAQEILTAFAKVDFVFLLYAFIVFIASIVVRIKKWSLMSGSVKLELDSNQLTGFYLKTRLMGQITPFRAGEALPAFFKPKDKEKFFSITVADRFYEGFTTFAIGLFSLYFFFSKLPNKANLVAFAIVFLLLGLLFFLAFTTKSGYSVLEKGLGKTKVSGSLDKYLTSLRTVLSNEGKLRILLITIAASAIDVIIYKFVFNAVGIDITILNAALSMAFLSVIIVLSPTPGGIGIAEAGYILLAGRLQLANLAQIGSFLITLRVLNLLMTSTLLAVTSKISGRQGYLNA